MGPVHNLAVRVMWIFGAERRPTDKTFKHDCSYRPPVAAEIITLATEDLRSNVVWGTDGGVGHDTTGFAPCIDLATIANSQVDLIQGNRVSITCLVR